MKKVVFLTGTRADYGKLKSLMLRLDKHERFEVHIFVTGMHALKKFGYTAKDVLNDLYTNIYINLNQFEGEKMELILGNTIHNFSRYIDEINPDLIVIHGDRIEALAGAIVGTLKNIHVAHIEGGESSGSIDESIRHSISKLSHSHFVSNEKFAKVLISMGESNRDIYIIGSPDYDIMFSNSLPNLSDVLSRLNIKFTNYGIFAFHSVTTEEEKFEKYSKEVISGLINSNKNFIIIAPNNDMGSRKILKELDRISGNNQFIFFNSIPFEDFLILLKNSKCVVGNSSVGVRQAPAFGIPSINIGSRQNNRSDWNGIYNVDYNSMIITNTINLLFDNPPQFSPSFKFGKGNSNELFFNILGKKSFWNKKLQK